MAPITVQEKASCLYHLGCKKSNNMAARIQTKSSHCFLKSEIKGPYKGGNSAGNVSLLLLKGGLE